MKSALRWGFSLALAVGLVALLLRWSGASPGQVAAALRGLDPRLHLAALALQMAIYPLRALRLTRLLPSGAPNLARLTSLNAAHILAANVLPAKIGEAALVVYLRRAGVPAANGLAALVVSRALDFAAVTGGLALACLGLATLGRGAELPWLLPLAATLAVPAVLGAWLSIRGEMLVVLAARALAAAGFGRSRLGARILALAERARSAFEAVARRDLGLAAVITVPIWILVFLFYGLLARGFGMTELSFPAAVFGSGLGIVATLLPLHGFAGFGVQDAGWVAGFTALGVERELATASGLAAHVVYLANIALLGVLGHLAMARWLSRSEHA